MFRIHMRCIVFCIYLAVLQSYLSLFLHITCIHFAKLGTEFNLKIDWLILSSVHFSICYFLCVNWGKYFFFEIWWIIIVQIFSLLDLSSKDHMFMGHIVSNLHILKERVFFFMCILNLFFLSLVCVSLFSPPPKFSPKLFFPNVFCFSYCYRGRNLFLTFVVHRGSYCSS